ncbi:hypothetical protein B4Q13_16860 [Lacticaseibacillus rhamnosus]
MEESASGLEALMLELRQAGNETAIAAGPCRSNGVVKLPFLPLGTYQALLVAPWGILWRGAGTVAGDT